jgi:hypothetical protein
VIYFCFSFNIEKTQYQVAGIVIAIGMAEMQDTNSKIIDKLVAINQ